jgi:hypothetical protein
VPGAEVGAQVESTMLVPTHGLPMRIHPADGAFTSSPIAGNVHELVDFDEAPAFVAGESAIAESDHHGSIVPHRPR